MRHLRLTAALAAGLIVPAGAAAASAPQWTASGKVTALTARSITVHGKTCHVVTGTPARRALRLFGIGASAKITCSKGILEAIARGASAGSSTGTAPATGTTSGDSTPITSSATSSPPVTTPPSAPVAPGPATISGGGPPGTA